MRVLLVQPSERLVVGKRKARGSIMPPLGLLALAAVVREALPKASVDIVDYEAKNDDPDPDFSTYDVVGLTGTTAHVPHIAQLLREIGQHNSKACVVLGGPHASFCDGQVLRQFTEDDAVVRGEGELSFPEFLRMYSRRDKLPAIAGISTRDGLSETLSPRVASLDDLPDPAYDLIDPSRYQLSTHRRDLPLPFASVITSRGCPFTCAYCQTPTMFGQSLRDQSPSRLARALRALKATQGIRSVVFWDDTFTFSAERTYAICRHIVDLSLQWMCNTRVECVSKELLAAMRAAGCKIIFYGVESAHRDTLTRLRRKTTVAQMSRAFQWSREVGIETVGTLMVGAPGDDFHRIEQSIDFLKSLKPNYAYISIYNVTPGAEEFKRVLDRGMIPEDINWADPTCFHGPPFGLPTANDKLNRIELQKAQKYAYDQFYGPGRANEYE